jgi:hypothetical protein
MNPASAADPEIAWRAAGLRYFALNYHLKQLYLLRQPQLQPQSSHPAPIHYRTDRRRNSPVEAALRL